MRKLKRLMKGGIVSVCVAILTFATTPICLSAEEPHRTDSPGAGAQSRDQIPPQAQTGPTTLPPSQDQTQPPAQSRAQPQPSQFQYTPMGLPVSEERAGKGLIKAGETLTVSRCIDIALKKNPAIVAAANTIEVNRSAVGVAQSAYWPQLSATGAYDRIKPAGATSAAVAAGVSTPYNEYTADVTLNQSIYDFGRTSSSVKAAKYNLASSRSDFFTSEDTIILSVKQAYYGVLQAKRNRDVAADVIKQFQLHLDQAKGFYEVGTAAKIDVIKAEVDRSNAQLSLINADNALKIAWVNLNNAMGVPDAPEYTIEDDLQFQKYTITLEEATEKAFQNRPDLQSIIAKEQAQEENIDLAKSNYYPILSGSATYNWAGINVPPNQLGNGWDVGANVTVPFFSGFLTTHQVAEAKSSLYVLKENEESLRQQIVLDVRQAYLNLQAAEASISTSELAAKQAKENLDLANGRYTTGVGSPVEVSDAFATYVSAQAAYTSALANYKIAKANIEKAMGAR